MKDKQKTILLVDGDTLAFRSAAAAESRTVLVEHLPSGRQKIFKTRTAFKDHLKEKKPNFVYKEEDHKFTDIQTEEDISHALHSIKNTLNKMKKDTGADEVRIFVGGPDNFRLKLPFAEIYKGNREDLIRPVHLDACKEYLIQSMQAELTDGDEADDALIYVGYAYLARGYKVVLGSQDKDSWAYSGLHIHDFTAEDPETWLISDLGEIYLDTSKKTEKVKGSGFLWFCHQWMLGDSTDNMNPRSILGIKWGQKSSLKLLQDCKTKQEAFDVVIKQYKKWFKDSPEYTDFKGDIQKATPEFMLQLYFRGVRMKTTPSDALDLHAFIEKEGLKYEP